MSVILVRKFYAYTSKNYDSRETKPRGRGRRLNPPQTTRTRPQIPPLTVTPRGGPLRYRKPQQQCFFLSLREHTSAVRSAHLPTLKAVYYQVATKHDPPPSALIFLKTHHFGIGRKGPAHLRSCGDPAPRQNPTWQRFCGVLRNFASTDSSRILHCGRGHVTM